MMKTRKIYAKKLIVLSIILALVLSLSSCSKEDNSLIVGTWVDGSTTMVLGSDGSYNLTDTSIPGLPQYRRGTYSYNPSQQLLSINVVAIEGENSAYQNVFIVQTLTESTLVLLYTDGDVEGYYTRRQSLSIISFLKKLL